MGPTTDQNISDAALSSPDDSMQGTDLACDPEQLDYPARPMTPGEEIMRCPDKEILCQTRETCCRFSRR